MDLDLNEGFFRRWLGKREGEKVTLADIEKGLKSRDPHVVKAARLAKNMRGWKKD